MTRTLEIAPIAEEAQGTPRPALITGGAGFIGTNVADRLLRTGRSVIIYDNLSRPGAETNLRWLRETHGSCVEFQIADVRDARSLQKAVQRAGEVYHFAAQVAVTTSLTDPVHDFEVNARGTLNLLSALTSVSAPPPLLFTSTNKVYGGLEDVRLERDTSRYVPVEAGTRAHGIGEDRPLDFHSPYGCSKGAADQYVIDYARTFGISAVVFRMSCIYGPHQFGNEDQGWVAHFLIRALRSEAITLFGDGLQVRDVLFVEDLVDAMLLARANISRLSGQAFNIGGSAQNTTSLQELIDLIGRLSGKPAAVDFAAWRPGDQRYYVSDTRRFQQATGWKPRVGVAEGVARLLEWLRAAGTHEKDVLQLHPRRDRAATATAPVSAAGGKG